MGLSQSLEAQFDDAYITYRYALNLLRGNGFVFNPGEAVLGTTAPLYGLLLAAVGALGAPLPMVSQVVGTLAWATAVPLLWTLARRPDAPAEGLTAAGLMATFPLALQVLGMETHLVIALQLAAILLAVRGREVAALTVAALATWLRPDAALLAAILAIVLWVRRRLPWRGSLAYLAVLAPWLLYAQLTYGSPLPNTLVAKAGQGLNPDLGGNRLGAFITGGMAHAAELYALSPGYALVALLALVGLVDVVRRPRPWWPLAAWAAAYTVAYALLGVNASPWYYPPLWPTLALLAGVGASAAVRLITAITRRDTAAAASLLLALAVLAPGARAMDRYRFRGGSDYYRSYVTIGEWLRANTPPGSSVALIEIGIIGYTAERTVIDTMGLVTPGMVGHLESWEQTLVYALARYWPDYAVALRGTAWDGVAARDWFRHAYTEAVRIPAPGPGARDATIYRRAIDPDAAALAIAPALAAGDVARLEALAAHDVRLQPGGALVGRVTWRGLRRPEADYRQRVELLHARTGRSWLLSLDHHLYGSNPTSRWSAGDVVEDLRVWALPADLEEGPYLLRASLVDAEGRTLPFAEGTPTAGGRVLGPLWVGDPTLDPYDIATPARARFGAPSGAEIELLGYDLDGDGFGAGASPPITLYWRALGPVSHDYTAFVHLCDDAGTPVAQGDGPPLAGALPTSWWLPGVAVRDGRSIDLPEALPPGAYSLRVGLYRFETMERLDVAAPDLPVADRALTLGDVTIR